MKTGKFEDFGIAPEREGILTMNMDTSAGPDLRPHLAHRPLLPLRPGDARDLKDFGPVCAQGEDGKGPTYRTICRSIAVDPDDGSAYFTDWRRDDPPLPLRDRRRRDRRGRRHEEGLLRPLRPDLARPHGLQLAAGRLGARRRA